MDTFKVITLSTNNIGNHNILIAKCSHGIDYDFQMSFTLTAPIIITFLLDSNLAQKIIAAPTYFDISLEDFTLQRIEFGDIKNEFGYLHNDLINKNLLNKKYWDISSVIAMKVFGLKYEEYDNLTPDEIDDIVDNYNDAINYAIGFNNSINIFVSNNPEAKNIAKSLGDNDGYYSNYIQKVIVDAIFIIKRRIKLNQNSKDYFGHEIVITDKRTEIKVFATFYGLNNNKIIYELFKNNQLEEILINYLSINKIDIITNNQLIEIADNNWVFQHREIITPFYIDKKNSLSYSNFSNQKRNKIFQAIFNQGQVNFSLLKI